MHVNVCLLRMTQTRLDIESYSTRWVECSRRFQRNERKKGSLHGFHKCGRPRSQSIPRLLSSEDIENTTVGSLLGSESFDLQGYLLCKKTRNILVFNNVVKKWRARNPVTNIIVPGKIKNGEGVASWSRVSTIKVRRGPGDF